MESQGWNSESLDAWGCEAGIWQYRESWQLVCLWGNKSITSSILSPTQWNNSNRPFSGHRVFLCAMHSSGQRQISDLKVYMKPGGREFQTWSIGARLLGHTQCRYAYWVPTALWLSGLLDFSRKQLKNNQGRIKVPERARAPPTGGTKAVLFNFFFSN